MSKAVLIIALVFVGVKLSVNYYLDTSKFYLLVEQKKVAMSQINYNEKTDTYYGVKTIEDDVLILVDDKEVISKVKSLTDSLHLNLIVAEEEHDLLTIGAYCIILDPDKVSPEYFTNFDDYYGLANPKEFAVILTKPTKLPKKITKFFVVAEDELEFEKQLRLTLLNRRSNIISRNTEPKKYTSRLRRLFQILRHLEKEGNYVTTLGLAKDFDVSEKTIKRDLQFLIEEGEDIIYDPKKAGYYLANSYNSNIITRFDSEIH